MYTTWKYFDYTIRDLHKIMYSLVIIFEVRFQGINNRLGSVQLNHATSKIVITHNPKKC